MLVQRGQLALQQSRNNVRFRDQILQLVVNRGAAHPLFTHTVGLVARKPTNDAFHRGLGPHFVKIFGKRRCDIIQPHDQLGDVGVHQFGMGMHVLKGRIFDINGDIRTGRHFLASVFNSAGQFRNFGLRLGYLRLAFFNLRVEIGHGRMSLVNVTSIYI